MIVVISPAWGERNVSLLCGIVSKSIETALKGRKARYIVHTDDPQKVKERLDAETYPVPQGEGIYGTFSACLNDGIQKCEKGDWVFFVNSDIVCSVETFDVVEGYFSAGKKMVVCAATRTLAPTPAPIGTARQVLDFTMTYKHPTIEECFYRRGTSKTNATTFFEQEKSVVLRAFHLHPIAIVYDRKVIFDRPLDLVLPKIYSEEETHVVTKPEMALAEISPKEKVIGRDGNRLSPEKVITWAAKKANKRHRWYARHRIEIQGDPDEVTEDVVFFERVLNGLG